MEGQARIASAAGNDAAIMEAKLGNKGNGAKGKHTDQRGISQRVSAGEREIYQDPQARGWNATMGEDATIETVSDKRIEGYDATRANDPNSQDRGTGARTRAHYKFSNATSSRGGDEHRKGPETRKTKGAYQG